MTYCFRVLGWLLLGTGTVLGVLDLLASNGLLLTQLESFGIGLDTSTERTSWVIGWLAAAALGLALLLSTGKRRRQDESRISQSPPRGSGWR